MAVKPFNINSFSKVNFMNPKEVGYQDSIDIIYDELNKTRKSFIKIGWYLKHINETEMYTEDGYANLYEFAHDKFNISQSTATRFMKLCTEFSVGHDSPELDEKYLDFSVSQLFEMLPMKQEEQEQVTPDMTVKDIREIKKKTSVKKAAELISPTMKSAEPDEEDDDNIPGQTSIEKDFPEYLPDSYNKEKVPDKEKIVEAEFREVIENELNIDREENAELEMDKTSLRDLRDEIEELADYVRQTFRGWKAAKKMPREEIEAAKKNAIKLTIAIEKLLVMI